jgi:CRP-like cAMP-binding protein
MPIFDELTSQELDRLALNLRPESLAAGEVLFREGDPGDKFYIIESGELAILQMWAGKPQEIARRGPGEYVGEIALLQNRPRTATIQAVGDTRLLSLEGEHFLELAASFYQVGQTLSRTGTRRLSFQGPDEPNAFQPIPALKGQMV